jgi:UDP:flavonoid glycosyltransferase YjiC (YdhE family)
MLVAGLGRNIEPEALGPLPPNVAAFSWTPQLRLLGAAACSVNHGGIHTINECIHFGVPMVVYSGQRYDQNGCAARIAYHGLGLRGDKDRDDADQIEAAIHRVLTEPAFRETMRRFQGHYERVRRSRYLEQTVGAFLEPN